MDTPPRNGTSQRFFRFTCVIFLSQTQVLFRGVWTRWQREGESRGRGDFVPLLTTQKGGGEGQSTLRSVEDLHSCKLSSDLCFIVWVFFLLSLFSRVSSGFPCLLSSGLRRVIFFSLSHPRLSVTSQVFFRLYSFLTEYSYRLTRLWFHRQNRTCYKGNRRLTLTRLVLYDRNLE